MRKKVWMTMGRRETDCAAIEPVGRNVGTGTASYEEWLGTPPEFDRIDETMETDVVVCGGGLAGVSAARAAVEEGAEAVLLEKTDRIQCRSGDIGVFGSELVRKHWGVENEPYMEEFFAQYMKSSGYWPKAKIIRYWMKNCGAAFDWYLGAKEDLYYLPRTLDRVPDDVKAFVQMARFPANPEYKVEEEYYPCYQVTMQLKPDQRPVLEAAFRKAMDTGRLTARFETPVKKLLRDEKTGRVTGVIAQDYDGRVLQVNARRGVVLATGDYSGNLDMLYYYCPWTRLNPSIFTAQDRNGNVADTGDGHRMGMWIGAQMERGPHAPMAHNMGGPLGVASYLQLDADGERFMNEDTFGQQIENQLYRLKDNYSWQIFDSAWPEQIPYMSMGHGSICKTYDPQAMKEESINFTLETSDGYVPLDAVEEAVRAGTAVKADTLEELVRKTGLPEEAALRSIARYNEMCRQGRDDDFGKTPGRLFPVERGPFYAAKFVPTILLVCMSGLESDEHARVLDGRGHVIPGLYAAGNVQGCRFSCEYPTTVPGMSHSMALTYGRCAGISAAKSV